MCLRHVGRVGSRPRILSDAGNSGCHLLHFVCGHGEIHAGAGLGVPDSRRFSRAGRCRLQEEPLADCGCPRRTRSFRLLSSPAYSESRCSGMVARLLPFVRRSRWRLPFHAADATLRIRFEGLDKGIRGGACCSLISIRSRGANCCAGRPREWWRWVCAGTEAQRSHPGNLPTSFSFSPTIWAMPTLPVTDAPISAPRTSTTLPQREGVFSRLTRTPPSAPQRASG